MPLEGADYRSSSENDGDSYDTSLNRMSDATEI